MGFAKFMNLTITANFCTSPQNAINLTTSTTALITVLTAITSETDYFLKTFISFLFINCHGCIVNCLIKEMMMMMIDRKFSYFWPQKITALTMSE